MEYCVKVGPRLPTLADLKNHLREEPLYYQVLEDYLQNAAKLVEDLRAKLEESKRRARENEAVEVARADLVLRASPPPSREQLELFHEIMEQQRELEREQENENQLMLVILEQQQQELEYLEENNEDEEPAMSHTENEGSWEDEMMAERRQVPQNEPFLNEGSVDMVPRAREAARDHEEEAVREIVLRSRTVRVPIIGEGRSRGVPIAASLETLELPAVQGLPEHYQQLLVAPEIDPYTVNRKDDGSIVVECGFCPKEFGTIKGWRIHAAKMHRQNGFCQKCGHFVDMPHARTVEEIAAVMELHSMEWCPQATKAEINERAAKRRRLELMLYDKKSPPVSIICQTVRVPPPFFNFQFVLQSVP
uniref:C2H2-type domain-containing protein n=1 Tax=Setaria digitata TaxID=48799 RepID=A0A915PDG2_9BILA